MTALANFPMELLSEAMKAKGGTGMIPTTGSYNSDSDDTLVQRILDSSEFHPALRTLSMRLMNRGGMSQEQVVQVLEAIMDESVAAAPRHSRHEDWLDRRAKIKDLVESASAKASILPGESPEDIAAMQEALKDHKHLVVVPAEMTQTVPLINPEPDEIDEDLVWFDSNQPAEDIKERKWLVGTRLMRGQFSVLSGPGSSGKSSLILATALAVASGQRVTGEEVHAQGNVLIINNEDPKSEMTRRLISARDHHGVEVPSKSIAIRAAPECLDDPEELRVAVKNGKHDEVQILENRLAWLEKQIVQNDIVYCSLDPLITLTRGISGVDNEEQGYVLSELRRLAFKTGCAIEVAAHAKKPPSGDLEDGAGDQTSIRGASSIVDTARIVYTVAPMGKRNAKKLAGGKKASEERVQDLMASYFRIDGAKANLAKKEGARWFHRVSHELPNGESVGVAQHLGPWSEVTKHAGIVDEDSLRKQIVAQALLETLGEGDHRNIKSVFETMKDKPVWPWETYGGPNKTAFAEMFAEPVMIGNVDVLVVPASEHNKTRMFLRISADD